MRPDVRAPWALLALGALIGLLVASGWSDGVDAWTGRLLADPAPSWHAVTIAGDVPVLGAAAGLAAAWLWRDRGVVPALRMLFVAGAGWAGTNLLKLAFSRPRPVDGAVEVASHAFPSGHAAGAMVVYVAWARLAAPDRRGMEHAAIGVGLVVGASRVALGVHHVTDVVAGWCLGLALVMAACPRPSSPEATDAAPPPAP